MKKILIIPLLFLVGACKTTKYVPIETIKTDTCYITKHQFDSIWLHDSIHIKEETKGDTVYVAVNKWHTKYIEKQMHDTLYIATHDTIPDPYPVATPLTWKQKVSIKFFPFVFAMACLLLLWVVRKPLVKIIRLWLK
jgi:hypothetical protein